MLFAIAFGWFLSISVRMIYPALLPLIRADYGLTFTTSGLLITVLWIAYAGGQLPGGILADWTGERILLIVSSFLSTAMLTLVVLADFVVVVFVATALFALGTALYGVSRFTILNEIYPDQLGTATGATMAAGDLGNAAMPPVAGAVAALAGWRLGIGFTIPFFVLAAGGLWITLPRVPGRSTGGPAIPRPGDLIPTVRRPAIFRGTLLLVLWAIMIHAFLGFYPTYLVDIKGIPGPQATTLFGFFFALGIVMKPLAGRAYDRIGVRLPLLVLVAVAGVGLFALPFAAGMVVLIPATAGVSTLLGYETILISDLTRRLPEEARATNLGALRTIYISIGALSPVAFGAVADRGYFDEGFLAVAMLAGVVFVAIFFWIDY